MTEKQSDNLYRIIGRNVAKRRKARGLSQREFAKQIYYSHNYVQRIEYGQKAIRIHELVSLAQALGCTILDLMSNEQ